MYSWCLVARGVLAQSLWSAPFAPIEDFHTGSLTWEDVVPEKDEDLGAWAYVRENHFSVDPTRRYILVHTPRVDRPFGSVDQQIAIRVQGVVLKCNLAVTGNWRRYVYTVVFREAMS